MCTKLKGDYFTKWLGSNERKIHLCESMDVSDLFDDSMNQSGAL